MICYLLNLKKINYVFKNFLSFISRMKLKKMMTVYLKINKNKKFFIKSNF